MKLLLDQNISYKLIKIFEDLYPESSHVYLLGLESASDLEIWEFAQENEYIIVTQDSDFYERSLIHGFPPKIVWLRGGNTGTSVIEHKLRNNLNAIEMFYNDEESACLEIY